MPTWITSRRLGATAVLYAVFVSGWYLGQPLPHVGCYTNEPATASEVPVTIGEPGDVSGNFSRVSQDVAHIVTYNFIASDAVIACDPYTSHPRLLAWVTGDWR